jgi:acyl-CoA thioester hydrolase
MFTYQRTIHVYETDLMSVVHHSNYLRFCEEARVAWLHAQGYRVTLQEILGLVVYETKVRHVYPIRYGDQVEIKVQLRVKGAKLIIQYLIEANQKIAARAESVHCRIDENFRVLRLDENVIKLVGKETWIETWL